MVVHVANIAKESKVAFLGIFTTRVLDFLYFLCALLVGTSTAFPFKLTIVSEMIDSTSPFPF